MGCVYTMISNIKLLTMKSINCEKENKYRKVESNEKKSYSIESNLKESNSIESDNSLYKVESTLNNLNLRYNIYSPDNKEEYDKFYDTMIGMFRVDDHGNEIIPKYTYQEGINKIFNK